MATRSVLKPGRERDRMMAAELIKRVGSFPGGTVELRIALAAQVLGWPLSRVENIWRQEARRIDSWEMDALRLVTRNRSVNGNRKKGRRKHRKK